MSPISGMVAIQTEVPILIISGKRRGFSLGFPNLLLLRVLSLGSLSLVNVPHILPFKGLYSTRFPDLSRYLKVSASMTCFFPEHR